MESNVDVVSHRVAREIHPIAVRQARERVMLLVLILSLFALGGVLTSFRRDDMWFVGSFSVAVIAAVYEVRWWWWLRGADPVDAYRRLQARTGREGGKIRSYLTLGVAITALGLWWFLGSQGPVR